MKCSKWSFKAYDENFKIHSGVEESTDFPTLALNLRQRGLQVIEAKRMNEMDAALEYRLRMMKSRFEAKKEPQSLIRKVWSKIASIFR